MCSDLPTCYGMCSICSDLPSCYGMCSGYWKKSELFLHVQEDLRQGNTGGSTHQPQQSTHHSPCNGAASAATKDQAIHQGDPTSSSDSCVPCHGLSDADPSSSDRPGFPPSVHQSVTQNDDTERDIAGLQSHPDNDLELFSFENRQAEDRTTSDHAHAPRDDPGDTFQLLPSVHQGIIQHDTQSAEESPLGGIRSTAFHDTYPSLLSDPVPETPQGGTTPSITSHQATFLAVNDHPASANDQVTISPTRGRRPIPTCGWDGGSGPCGMNVHEDGIAEHMNSYHGTSGIMNKCRVRCLWIECQKTPRRDTLFRHISEKHYGIPRLKPGKRHTMSQQIAV